MSGIPTCPVCDAFDDCRHCLVEWRSWPGQRFRGVLMGLIDRIEDRVADLLVECSLAHVPPRAVALTDLYRAAVEIVAGLRAAVEAEIEDEEASAQAYWTARIDREELRDELLPLATEFAVHCVRQAPGVTEIAFGDLVSTAEGEPEWISLWSADPGEVQQHLLELLAPIEAQLRAIATSPPLSPASGRSTSTSG